MTENSEPKFDEIGEWSEIKLEILRKYAPVYTSILSNQSFVKGYYYIDGFSGYGIHKSKTRDDLIEGSPSIALKTNPPFTAHYWVDLNSKKVEFLKRLSDGHPNVNVFDGDCNDILVNEIFPTIQFSQFKRALCLLDPYGIHLNWNVIEAAGRSKSIEIFLNFPIMDINRNVLRTNPDRVDPANIKRMDFFWGDDSWKQAAYRRHPGLFDTIEEKTSNNDVVSAFQKRLKEVAGFNYVPDPIPMKNDQGATVYYLFFATPNKTAHKIVVEIMNKYRDRGIM